MDWYNAVERVSSQVVRITTPSGHGTGFLTECGDEWITIATAAHVVAKAHSWEEPIRVHHTGLKEPVLLHFGLKDRADRAIVLHESLDVAVILSRRPNFGEASFPQELVQCIPSGQAVHRGIEVGWLGYPYLVDDGTRCCFFSGNISAFANGRYFIDGVAIEGVSGGPAFYTKDDEVYIIGCISEYKSATLKGIVPVPGLLVADNVSGLSETPE